MRRYIRKPSGTTMYGTLLFASMLVSFEAVALESTSVDSEWCSGVGAGDLPPREALQAMRSRIARQFMQSDFANLVRTATTMMDRGCLSDEGELLSDYLLSGFTEAFEGTQEWNARYSQLQRFHEAFPGHPLPYLAESRYWSDYATLARGLGSAATVSEDGWKLFRERSKRAAAVLEDSKSTSAAWPQWYIQMIRVRAHASDTAGARAVFREGAERFREQLAIFSEMAYYSEPRWGGSWDAVDEIVRLATESIKRESPEATYARMYMQTGKLSQTPSQLFSATRADWSRMRTGLVELVEANPNSELLRARLLAFACIARDSDLYLVYRTRSEALFPNEIWRSEVRTHCDALLGYGSQGPNDPAGR